jgi:pepsin A
MQANLNDNAYVADVYVGNPPQKIRALFDTGSTNAWVLHSNVELPNNATKQFAYDDKKSLTVKHTN